jgi:uncharacterized membrane protein (UPF0182 family)
VLRSDVARRWLRLLLWAGAGLVVTVLAGRLAAGLYTEFLWYGALDRTDVLWTRLGAVAVVRMTTGLLGAGVVLANLMLVVRPLGAVHLRRRYGNLEIAERVPPRYVNVGIVATALLAGLWLSGIVFPEDVSLGVLAWLQAAPWGYADPVFDRDVSFFVFALPNHRRFLDFVLLALVWSALLGLVGYVLIGSVRVRRGRVELDENARLHFAVLAAAVVLVLGARYWLGRYGIVLEGGGFAGGVGYTDVHARLPAQRVLAVLSLGVAGALVYGASRRVWWPPLTALGLLLVASLTLGTVYPAIVQKLQVEPNQLVREAPFIRWNIDFTRRAWDLDAIERRPMPYEPLTLAGGRPSFPADLDALPLWDPEPLQAVFNEVQTFSRYYAFPSVHLDRYGRPGDERPVAIAVREFAPEGLPPGSRTWRTLHLNARQVRGAGVVVTPVAETTSGGDPVYWLAGLSGEEPLRRSEAAPAQVEVREPSIYFGETMAQFLVLGPDVVREAVERTGVDRITGVPLSSFARVLAFAWRFGDRNLLFSGELTRESQLLFRRRVVERVARLVPFVRWDREALPVLAGGRVVWLLDGYVTSTTYPIARPQLMQDGSRVRYVRSSVKAAVDAVTGAVTLYAVHEDEPLLAAWRRVFPDLILPLEAMPHELRAHLRYPATLVRLQAAVLASYHVDEPDLFFAGQNEWQVPQDPVAAGSTAPFKPTYLMLRAPGDDRVRYWVTMPFIARGRQNLTAVLLLGNDADAYGQALLLQFPRDQQVTGPTQVRTLIEQDPTISPQLSLLRTGERSVDLGRLRIVPVDSALLYVQPLYVSAMGSSIPQLHRVIVSDGVGVHMGRSLAEALAGLHGTAGARRPTGLPAAPVVPPAGAAPAPAPDWLEEALRLHEEAERRLRAGDWQGFGEAWRRLREVLTLAHRREPGP